MHRREFVNDQAQRVTLVTHANQVMEHYGDHGGSLFWNKSSEKEARSWFNRVVREILRRGFVESERSLTLRIFLNSGRTSHFWMIELDGSSHTVQYGKVPANPYDWTIRTGQKRTTEFHTRQEAVTSCKKLIARKLRLGYGELRHRWVVPALGPGTDGEHPCDY